MSSPQLGETPESFKLRSELEQSQKALKVRKHAVEEGTVEQDSDGEDAIMEELRARRDACREEYKAHQAQKRQKTQGPKDSPF